MRRLLAHREQDIPLISHMRPEAPSELDHVFAKMMAKKKEDRYPSMQHLVVALKSIELDDAEAEQMATIDAPDDGTGGFIKLPEEDQLDDSVEQSAFSDSSATAPTGSRVLDTASSAADATLIESDSQLSNTVVVSDADSLAQGESFSEGPSTTSPSESPQSGEAQSGSSPPWKIILPSIAAVLAIAIFFALSRNGNDESGTPESLAVAEPKTGTQTSASGAATPDSGSQAGTAVPGSNEMSPDRRAAEWVVSIGGTVLVTDGQQNVKATEQSQLPDDPFVVTGVDLFSNPRVTDEGLTNLQGLSGLRSLVAWDTSISDAGLANLTDSGKQALPNLSVVHLQVTRIGDTGLSYLVGSPIDHSLLIAETGVSDPDLLRKFANVQHLNIGLTSVPLSRLDFLEDFNHLTVLNLDARQWNALAADVPTLAESLKQVSVFDRTSTRIDERLLERMPNLTSLSMNGPPESQFDEAFWTALAALPAFEDLRLDAEITDEALTHLQPMPRLHTLHLDSTTITGNGFAKAAQQLPGLQALSLTNGKLTDNDIDSLATLKTLQQFDLNRNQITALGIASLQQALPGCQIISDRGTFEPTVSMRSNWALSFDGRDDYVEIPDIDYSGISEFTIEGWIQTRERPRNADGYRREMILKCPLGGLDHRTTGKNLNDWSITATLSGQFQQVRAGQVSQWQHVAYCLGSGEWTVYVNGKSDQRRLLEKFTPDGQAATTIGAAKRGTRLVQFFHGLIGQIRISRQAVYSEDFTPAQWLVADANTLLLYHIDEGQGTVLKDSSGNGHNGVIHGATWIERSVAAVAPPRQYALSFDGKDDYVELPLTYDSSHPITLEAWARAGALTTHPSVLGNRDGLYKGLTLKIDTRSGRNLWALMGNQPDNGPVAADGRLDPNQASKVRRNEWVHLAGTWDGRRMRFFVNGKGFSNVFVRDQQIAADAAVQLQQSNATFAVGGRPKFFNGDIRGVRISKNLRYVDDFEPPRNFQPDEHTLAAYDFSRGAGNVLPDLSGNGHDGTIHGATWIAIRKHHGLKFQADGDAVIVDSLAWDGTSPRTVEGWIIPDPEAGPVFNQQGPRELKLASLDNSPNWMVSFTKPGEQLVALSQRSVSSSGRLHVATTFDGQEPKLWLNGRLATGSPRSVSHDLDRTTIAPAFVIGAHTTWNLKRITDSFRGVIDEVRVSDVVRYNSQFTPRDRFEADEHTLALYHFDEGQGTVLKDSSNNGHDGAIRGAKWIQTGDVSELPAAPGRDRAAAEWILKYDGSVIVKLLDGSKSLSVKAGETLPDSPFYLTQLNLNEPAPEDEFANLAGLTELEGAFINYFPLTDAALANLKDSKKLRSLHVEGTQITDGGLDILTHFPLLEGLQISAGFTDEGLQHVLQAKQLKRLSL